MTRYLITSALPYINGVKHLGNLVGSMLPADVYARYLRQRGEEVLFICATDEHGTPAELAAADAGIPVSEYCRQQHELQATIYTGFSLSFDHFGRSSSSQNRALTQHIAGKLDEGGLLEERSMKLFFSPSDGRFLPDRYVVGTCPYCGFDRARGDQCENCTRLLDPVQLVSPRSAISDSTDLQVRETKHLYFRQSQLASRLRNWIEQQAWPQLTTSIAMKWLNEGIEDRGITRDLEWGIPVDRPGFEGKVFYVWFDAPIEYIAATHEWADQDPRARDWKSWWYATHDVRYVQFMAKDNIPFHTIMFPATIMGSGEPWKLPDYIKGFNWLTYYGDKFSTSRGYGIFMDAALKTYPSDYWRYFLLANAPESDDVSFTWELFAAQVNKDLGGILGNFVNRVLTFTTKQFGEATPEGGEPNQVEAALGEELEKLLAVYESHLDSMQYRKAVHTLKTMWSAANVYLNEKTPWVQIRTDREAAALTLRTAMNLIYLFGRISAPIIPETAAILRGIWSGTNAPDSKETWPTPNQVREMQWVPAGVNFNAPGILFNRITSEDVANLRQRFGAPPLDQP